MQIRSQLLRRLEPLEALPQPHHLADDDQRGRVHPAVTADQLQSAYTGAQKEIQTEALKSRLDEMVTNGTITQDQEDAYLNWLSQRPDIGGGIGAFPGMGRMHGFDGFRGFGKLWPPATQTPPPTTQSN